MPAFDITKYVMISRESRSYILSISDSDMIDFIFDRKNSCVLYGSKKKSTLEGFLIKPREQKVDILRNGQFRFNDPFYRDLFILHISGNENAMIFRLCFSDAILLEI